MSKETKDALISVGVILTFLAMMWGMIHSLNTIQTEKPMVIYDKK